MNMVEIITDKKLGKELNREQIAAFVKGAAQGTVPEYQLAALLMAIRLNGMTARETTDLTLEMTHSGDIADLSSIPGIKVDKHSTGGVGDTTTLILAPLVAACGAPVAKMSGRGLGHTGGTLDKLESIPGMSVALTEAAFLEQVRRIGVAVIGQTGSLAPADRTLYALRDVTATVDSLPLIASSIMSKKLAAGSDAIVLDVKTGSGAVMQTLEGSMALARAMVAIGELAGKPVTALVTGMEQPLGTHVGNALEVRDALDVLSGRTKGDLLDVSLLLGSHMLVLARAAKDLPEAEGKLRAALESGAGLEKFREMISAQGGEARVADDPDLLPKAKVIRRVKVGRHGFVAQMDTMRLGLAAQGMGAGRVRKEDALDYAAGFVLPVRIGDEVHADDLFFTLHASSEAIADRAEQAVRDAIVLSETRPERPPLWYAQITREGTALPEGLAADVK